MNWEAFKPKEETVYDRSFYCIVDDQAIVIDVIEFKDAQRASLFYCNPHKPSIPPVDVDEVNIANDSFNQIFEDLNDETWVVRVLTIFNLKKHSDFDEWVGSFSQTLSSPIDINQRQLMQKAWDAAKVGVNE